MYSALHAILWAFLPRQTPPKVLAKQQKRNVACFFAGKQNTKTLRSWLTMNKCCKCHGWFVTGEKKVIEFGNIVHERCSEGGGLVTKDAPATTETFEDKLAGFSRKSYEAIVKLEDLQIEILSRYSKVEIYDRNYDFHIKPYLLNR